MKNKVKILLENILKESAEDRSNRPKIKLRAMWQDRDQRRLEQLLKKLQQEVIDGSLIFEDNESITNLGNIKHVKGHLLILNCKNLKELPEGLIVEGNLAICYSNLEELPASLKVEGHLDLIGCNFLKSLPSDLKVGDKLNLSYCRQRVKDQAIEMFGKDKITN